MAINFFQVFAQVTQSRRTAQGCLGLAPQGCILCLPGAALAQNTSWWGRITLPIHGSYACGVVSAECKLVSYVKRLSQALLGYLLPCYVAVLLELRSRHAFLKQHYQRQLEMGIDCRFVPSLGCALQSLPSRFLLAAALALQGQGLAGAERALLHVKPRCCTAACIVRVYIQ